ncbi:HAD-IIA family hydrolase [Gracilibacillus alcaliphilus]|uniref:HAD-IIA family hydrolase n=1 Tax=Gracilibacillus alcaliphilus TaxID=1401441 RepID=UPI00195D8136|nr:arabinose operon protein AraL [Gracilibacillus alcaliphilus]
MNRGFIFDLDGTIYVGDRPVEGAKETIQYLRNNGDKVIFLTNKPISTRSDYVKKLTHMGIETKCHEIISSGSIAAHYLRKRLRDREAVLVVGEKPLLDELRQEKIPITEDPHKANFVLLSWDRQFNYEKLNKAYQAWYTNGAQILATNSDRTCPEGDGQVPDSGAIVGAIEGATGQPIDYVVGKPSRFAAQYVVHEVLGLAPENCYIVGDRLETDIQMGIDNGLHTILVLTGITKPSMLTASHPKPTYVMESVRDILNWNN